MHSSPIMHNEPSNLFAVCGNPVEHSLSPQLQQLFAQQCGLSIHYTRQQLPIDDESFEDWVKHFFASGGSGLNITLPFKQRAFELADVPSKAVMLSEAANTLYMRDGVIHAQNTDGVGLMHDFKYLGIDCTAKKVLILGAGGAVAGILPAILATQPASCVIANRTIAKAHHLTEKYAHLLHTTHTPKACSLGELGKLDTADIVIHALAIGTASTLTLPIDESSQCYDLSYASSAYTPFCRLAHQQGAGEVYDGLGMLVEQGAISFSHWFGTTPDTHSIRENFRRKYGHIARH